MNRDTEQAAARGWKLIELIDSSATERLEIGKKEPKIVLNKRERADLYAYAVDSDMTGDSPFMDVVGHLEISHVLGYTVIYAEALAHVLKTAEGVALYSHDSVSINVGSAIIPAGTPAAGGPRNGQTPRTGTVAGPYGMDL
jgi:Na+(H+)/acetate symporter ActP